MWPSLEDLTRDIRSGKIKAIDLVNRALDQIEKYQDYHAIISINREMAIKRAHEIDKELGDNKNSRKRLPGIPFIAKDNFLSTDGYIDI